MMLIRSTFKTLAAASAFVFSAGAAQALPTFYDDRAAFEAAAGAVLDFESFEAFLSGSPVALPGFTASETNDPGNEALGQSRLFGSSLAASITDGTGGIAYFDRGGSTGNFFDFADSVTAFGIDIFSTVASSVVIGGSVEGSIDLAQGSSAFWGVISASPISALSFEATANDPEAGSFIVAFDSASFGEAAIAPVEVPVPATLVLLFLGMAGISWRRIQA